MKKLLCLLAIIGFSSISFADLQSGFSGGKFSDLRSANTILEFYGDELSGDSLVDRSGNGHTGARLTLPISTPIDDNYWHLSGGSNDCLLSQSTAVGTPTGSFTAMALVRSDSLTPGANRAILTKNDLSSDKSWHIYQDSGTDDFKAAIYVGGVFKSVTVAGSVDITKDQLVKMTWNDTTFLHTLTVIDDTGTSTNSANHGGAIDKDPAKFGIGCQENLTQEWFNRIYMVYWKDGQIMSDADALSVYNQTLDPNSFTPDIYDRMHQGACEGCSSPTFTAETGQVFDQESSDCFVFGPGGLGAPIDDEMWLWTFAGGSSNDSIVSQATSTGAITGSFTAYAIIRVRDESPGTANYIMSKDDRGSNQSWAMWYPTAGENFQIGVYLNGGNYNSLTLTNVLDYRRDQLVMITWDESTDTLVGTVIDDLSTETDSSVLTGPLDLDAAKFAVANAGDLARDYDGRVYSFFVKDGLVMTNVQAAAIFAGTVDPVATYSPDVYHNFKSTDAIAATLTIDTSQVFDVSGTPILDGATVVPVVATDSRERSAVVLGNGNSVTAHKFLGSDDYYEIAHHADFNINDSDHVYSFYGKANVDGGVFFSHGADSLDGLYVFQNSGNVDAVYSNGGAKVTVSAAATLGYYHWIDVVRDSGTVTVYVDGVAGTPVDATGFGIDGSRAFTVGALSDGTLDLDGEVSYFKVDNAVLELNELNKKRETAIGILSNLSWVGETVWSIARSTIGTITTKTGLVKEVANGNPRIADGVLVEVGATNIATENEDLDHSDWTKTRSSISSTTELAPDDSNTADILHEDATAANTHVVFQAATISSGVCINFSANVKAGTRDWARLSDISGGTRYAYFDVANGVIGGVGGDVIGTPIMEKVANGFYRIGFSYISTTTSTLVAIHIAEADNDNTFDGLDADSLIIWRPQITEQCYSSSSIHTETSAVARTADDVTIGNVLNDESTIFTVEFKAKCLFNEADEIDSTKNILEISGNTGTASVVRNRLTINMATDGKLHAQLIDDSIVAHEAYTTADVVDYRNWFMVQAHFDGTDYSNNTLKIGTYRSDLSSAGVTYSGNSGTGVFDTTGTLTRIGQTFDGSITGDCKILDLYIIDRS